MTQNNISVFAFLGSSLWCSFVSLFICSVSGLYGFREVPEKETARMVLLSRVQGEKVESSLISCATVNPVTQCTDTVGPGTTQD